MKVKDLVNNNFDLNKASIPDLIALGISSKDCLEYLNWLKVNTPSYFRDKSLRQENILLNLTEDQFNTWKIESDHWVKTFRDAERLCSKYLAYLNQEAMELLDGSAKKYYAKTRFSSKSYPAVDCGVNDLKNAQKSLKRKKEDERETAISEGKITTPEMIDAMAYLALRGKVASQDYEPKDALNIATDVFVEEYIKEKDGKEIEIGVCDECNHWTAGERRCSCGNRRICWCSEGIYPNIYIFPDAY